VIEKYELEAVTDVEVEDEVIPATAKALPVTAIVNPN
jgi:hypothetical protein